MAGRADDRETTDARRLDRPACGEQRRLVAGLGADGVEVEQRRFGRRSDHVDEGRNVTALDVVTRRGDGLDPAAELFVEDADSLARLWMPAGGMQPRVIRVTDDVHLARKRARREPVGQLVQAPAPNEGGRLRPYWGLILQGRERGGGVEGRNSSIQQQFLPLIRKSSGVERRLQRAVLSEDRRGRLRPDSAGTRQAIRGVAA